MVGNDGQQRDGSPNRSVDEHMHPPGGAVKFATSGSVRIQDLGSAYQMKTFKERWPAHHRGLTK